MLRSFGCCHLTNAVPTCIDVVPSYTDMAAASDERDAVVALAAVGLRDGLSDSALTLLRISSDDVRHGSYERLIDGHPVALPPHDGGDNIVDACRWITPALETVPHSDEQKATLLVASDGSLALYDFNVPADLAASVDATRSIGPHCASLADESSLGPVVSIVVHHHDTSSPRYRASIFYFCGAVGIIDLTTLLWIQRPTAIRRLPQGFPLSAAAAFGPATSIVASHCHVALIDERQPPVAQSSWRWACGITAVVEALHDSDAAVSPFFVVGTEDGRVALFDVRRPSCDPLDFAVVCDRSAVIRVAPMSSNDAASTMTYGALSSNGGISAVNMTPAAVAVPIWPRQQQQLGDAAPILRGGVGMSIVSGGHGRAPQIFTVDATGVVDCFEVDTRGSR